jgi:hypothetical protein
MIGHNRPPMEEAHRDILDRLAELQGKALPFAVSDDETAITVSAIGKSANEIIKSANDAHKGEKEPWLEGGRAVDRFFFDGIRAPAQTILKECKALVDAWQDQKEAEGRRQREAEARAARLAAEAVTRSAQTEADVAAAAEAEGVAIKAEKALQAKPAEIARVQSDTGRVVAQRRAKWTFEITDEAALPRDLLTPNVARIQARIDGGAREIPGCRVYEKKSTVFA